MSPKTKNNNFPSIRVLPSLRTETEKACEILDVTMSDYIRLAVTEKNKKVLKNRKE